jgi:hypothetical protein
MLRDLVCFLRAGCPATASKAEDFAILALIRCIRKELQK